MTDHGTFIWNELNTYNAKRACDFYARLLGWRFEEMPMPDGVYRVAIQGDQRVAGVFEMTGKDFDGLPPQWLAYIVGRIAILKDVVGAPIALMTPLAA
jgi:predicted enzyme related to lactoylglutathione lyase